MRRVFSILDYVEFVEEIIYGRGEDVKMEIYLFVL